MCEGLRWPLPADLSDAELERRRGFPIPAVIPTVH